MANQTRSLKPKSYKESRIQSKPQCTSKSRLTLHGEQSTPHRLQYLEQIFLEEEEEKQESLVAQPWLALNSSFQVQHQKMSNQEGCLCHEQQWQHWCRYRDA